MKKGTLFFLLILILIGVYFQWWIPGPKVANDFPLFFSSTLKPFMDFPRLWSEYGSEGLGEYTVFTLWSWPFMFLTSLAAHLGLSFELIERFLIMIPFLLLGSISIWKFGESLGLSKWANFISSIFYLTNSYILLVLDGGQLSIGLAYAFFPLSFLAIKNSIDKKIKAKILVGLSVWFLGLFDFRFIYIVVLLSLFYFLFELFLLKSNRNNYLKQWTILGLIVGAIVAGLNAYWLIPLFLNPLSNQAVASLTQSSFVSLINLGHSTLMLSPNWFKNVFGNVSSLRPEFFLLPFLAFLAPVLKPKDKAVAFWMLVALMSIFLAKGFSEPFGNIYELFFKNLPGFSLFRDSTKFFFPLSLSYAVLIGISVDEIIKRSSFKYLRTIFPMTLVLYLVFIIRPVWTSQMNGTFSTQPFEKNYQRLYQVLDNDKEFSRIFWVPFLPALGPLTTTHPSVEASRLVQKRPFGTGTVGTYELFNFLREAPYMEEIFDIVGIGYIAYPYLDIRRANSDSADVKYYYLFLSQISKLPWLTKVEESQVPLWKVKNSQDKFFLTQNTFWVIGSDDIYNEATKSSKLKLSKNALIFGEESAGFGKKLDQLPDSKIILNKKSELDLAASFIEPEDLIFPAKDLSYDPSSISGWWKRETKDLISWKDFLKTKYGINNQDFDLGGGWAVGEGKLDLVVNNPKIKKNKILLARILESTRSGQLRFFQDKNLIGEVNTKKDGDNFKWLEIGKLTNDQTLKISSQGEINVMNALSLIDENKWNNYKNKAKGLKEKVVDFDEKNATESQALVTYQKLNPTKYKISVSKLKNPQMLIFSENYDSNWKLNLEAPLPVYSLLNGFKVERDGEYILEYEPQKYVFVGLVISALTLLGLCVLILV